MLLGPNLHCVQLRTYRYHGQNSAVGELRLARPMDFVIFGWSIMPVPACSSTNFGILSFLVGQSWSIHDHLIGCPQPPKIRVPQSLIMTTRMYNAFTLFIGQVSMHCCCLSTPILNTIAVHHYMISLLARPPDQWHGIRGPTIPHQPPLEYLGSRHIHSWYGKGWCGIVWYKKPYQQQGVSALTRERQGVNTWPL